MRKYLGMIVIAGLIASPSASRAQIGGGTGGGATGAGGGLGGGAGGGQAGGGQAGRATGGQAGGGQAGRTGVGGSTTAAVPSPNNPFYSSYANPQAIGFPSSTSSLAGTSTSSQGGAGGTGGGGGGIGTASSSGGGSSNASSIFGSVSGGNLSGTAVSSKPFGQPLYAVSASQTATGAASVTSNAGTGFNTVGIKKAPVYGTVLSDDIPIRIHNAVALEQNLQNILARSSQLRDRQNIRVSIEQDTVVLRGQVQSAREKRLAEALLRLTPGVGQIANLIEAPNERPNYPIDD